jgi:hypothetical protein
MLSGEATNTNLIVFGLTRQALEPTIYRNQGKHANHYATDAVVCDLELCDVITQIFSAHIVCNDRYVYQPNRNRKCLLERKVN